MGGHAGVLVVLALLLVGWLPQSSAATPPAAAAAAAAAAPAPRPAAARGSQPAVAARAPDLTGWSLVDLSFIGPKVGFALAGEPCARGICARLAKTTDGGLRWRPLPDPPAEISGSAAGGCSGAACESNVLFANRAVGYLYGPALLMTRDGGRTWHREPGLDVEALGLGAGRVVRIAYGHSGCPGPCRPILQEAPLGSTAWRTLVRPLDQPGRSGSAQIVASGRHLLVALYGDLAGPVSAQAVVYRSSDSGATWRRIADPCSAWGRAGTAGEKDLVSLASARDGFFAGVCNAHSGTTRGFVVMSSDAGLTWHKALGSLPDLGASGLVAVASPTTLAATAWSIGRDGRYRAGLIVSTDGGRRWALAAVDSDPEGLTASLGLEGASFGWWIGDPHHVFFARGNVRRWERRAFP